MEPLRDSKDDLPAAGAAGVGDCASTGTGTGAVSSTDLVAFGKPMRALFSFAPGHHSLNHGSYGTFPAEVQRVREQRLHDHEARPDLYKRFEQPALHERARAAVAPLLGADVHVDEVALVANATTGVNIVLHNLAARWSAAAGDAVLYFRTMYAACHKTLQALAETGRLVTVEVPVTYYCPADSDDAVLDKLRAAYAAAVAKGLTPRLVVFDTVVSIPGVRMPWERLAAVCRDELHVQSLIDGAHALGQLDLTSLGGTVRPDFFVSNAHKWLFVPRGCAVLYVPFRNQPQLFMSLPVSHGFEPDPARRRVVQTADKTQSSPQNYFTQLFAEVGTLDYTPHLCIPEAIAFRQRVCGGEQAIRDYCFRLAADAADLVAARLGTDVIDHPASRIRQCCLATVRLPLTTVPDGDNVDLATGAIPLSRVADVWQWMQRCAADEYDTYFMFLVYEGHFWVRLSAQIYLDLDDFAWAADRLLDLCNRVKKGEWKKE